MKIEMSPQLHPRRGDEVKVGNVYANAHGFSHYKIVLAVIPRDNKWKDKPWNNCICIHVDSLAGIVGCSKQPQLYLSEHNDLVGRVKSMPELRIEWLRPHPQKDRLERAAR